MYVLTIDQQDSRSSDDAVPAVLAVLEPIDAVIPFARTIGDEVQGVLDDPAAVAEAIRRIAVASGWHIGLGIGDVERPLPTATTEARGQAFYAARQAVESAKSAPAHLVVRSEGESTDRPLNERESTERTLAEAALRLLVNTLGELRTHSRGYVDHRLDHPDATQAEIAAFFGVSQQAVSRVLASGTAEIVAGAQELSEYHLRQSAELRQMEGGAHVD
ncbi:hypothetical protein [Brevibacterium atlanticum]|uniref:hypothetical protein n=1 Tax=Brevibacterium atlanticum TaxID=2697563 RepID=UPI00142403FA|nr:hypothetical protein [Brevibacterium atlanticum]